MRIVCFLIVFCFCLFTCCFALEWRRLHEQADRMTPKELSSSRKIDPSSIADLYVMGLVYLNAHQDQEAEEAFIKMKQIDPACLEAEWGRAEVLRTRHDPTAEGILRKIIQKDPEFLPTYVSLAYIEYLKGNFSAAVQLVSKVVRKGQDGSDLAIYVRALCLYAGSKGMLAHYGKPFSKVVAGLSVKKNLDRAEKLQPNSAIVLFGLGSYYLLAPALAGGDLEKAEVYLKKAIKVDPLFANPYVRLAQLYKTRGMVSRYDEYLKKALEIDPKCEIALDIKSGRCRFICLEESQ